MSQENIQQPRNLPILDGSESSEDEDGIPPRKKRVVGLWTLDREFDTSEQRNQYIDAEEVWRKKRSNVHSEIGLKSYFYCNVISKKKSAAQCPARIYTLDSNTAVKFSVYRNGMDHVHDKDGQIPSKKPEPLRDDLMHKVKEYLDVNAKPRVISHKLRNDENIEKPSVSQVKK